MSYPVTRRRFSVAEYHQMIANAILTKQDHVELINGEIVEMSPISPNHAGVVDRINKLLSHKADDSVIVRVQNPIQLDDYSEPQSDLCLVKARDDFYRHSHPKADDVLLVIEVAESSALRDRIVKAPEYAKALIAELWLIDFPKGLIEIFADPLNGSYQSIRQARHDEKLTPRLLPSLVVKVEELLG